MLNTNLDNFINIRAVCYTQFNTSKQRIYIHLRLFIEYLDKRGVNRGRPRYGVFCLFLS